MKRTLLTFLFLFISFPLFAQVSLTGSMGINYFAAASMRDYLNMNYPSNSGLVSTFTSSVGFYGELSMPVASKYDLGLEYMYQIYSYNSPAISGGNYNFSLDQQRIALIGYYVISGESYKLKFGLGGALKLASVDEEIYTTINYKSAGFSIFARVNGLTPLGKDIYANLGVEAGYDITGEPSSSGNKIVNGTSNKNLSLNSFFVGLKIGITYTF
jgi:hypothetical protein